MIEPHKHNLREASHVPSAREIEHKSTRNQARNRQQIDQNRGEVYEKSIWVGLGAQSRFGDAAGRAWGSSATPKNYIRADLEGPGASQERPGTGQKLPQVTPGTLPGDSGAVPERTWCTKQCRTRLRNDFALFLSCRAKARSLNFVRPRSVS